MSERPPVIDMMADILQKRIMLFWIAVISLNIFVVVVTIGWINPAFSHSLAFTIIVVLVQIPFVGFFLSIIGEAVAVVFVREKRALQEKQRREREEALTKRLSALTQEHPELIEFLEIQRIEQERLEEARRRAEQRSFWQGVAQNFIFFLLGVLVPILFQHFHLLGQ
ncbi:MAG TPA: hypothetical protein VH593_02180 [Ktedonobacteraceae bacterium]|jgi:ABC-type multidrug transport system fused ATPase/permease subunit